MLENLVAAGAYAAEINQTEALEEVATADQSMADSQLKLTKAEQDWLAKHTSIRFAFPESLPPYSMVTKNGEKIGFIHDWFKLLSQTIGTTIEIVPHDLPTLLKGLDDGQYDGIAGVTYSKNMRDDYIYTDEVVSAKWGVFTSKNALSYSSFSQVKNKSFALLNGSLGEPVIRALYPNINLIKYPTIFAALKAVETGDTFAVIGESRSLNHVIKKKRLFGIVENFIAYDLNIKTAIKIRKDWGIFGSIINKAQASITDEKKSLLQSKWLKPSVQLSHLTLDEIKWLTDKKSIDINFYELPPYLMKTNHTNDGFLVDYFNLFEQMLGIDFNLVIVPKAQFPMNDDGSLPEAALTLPKERFADRYQYTDSFFNTIFGMFTLLSTPEINDIEEMRNTRVGVLTGTPPERQLKILAKDINIKIINYVDKKEMIDDLLIEDIDAIYAGSNIMRTYLSRHLIPAVKLNWLDTKNIAEHSLAVRSDLSPLIAILSKSWEKIEGHSQARIFEKWLISESFSSKTFKASDSTDTSIFNDNEIEWIKKHPVIYFSDLTWLPYINISESNEVTGIGKDYLDIIAKDSGISFQYVYSKDWQGVIDKLKKNAISLSLAAGISKERQKYARFSEPYISSPMSIVTSDKYSYVQNLEQLNGLTIAIPEGLFIEGFLKSEHPEINLVYTDTIYQSLEMVADDRADAFIGSMAVVGNYLRRAELYMLRVSGLINQDLTIHFMVGMGNEILVDIINKSLAKIDPAQKRQISNRWFSVNLNTGIDSEKVYMILLIASLMIGLSLYWIRRLKLEINQKNLIQQALKSARVDADLANKAKSEFLANMSHEIRTPMNAIVGFSHLLSESDLSEKQQSYLRSIRIGSDGLLHIINDILDLSKIEAGKMQIDYSPTDLLKLIEELELLFHGGMKDKGIDFTIDVDLSVPRYVSIDANRVRQILLNIIGNAQKFTDCGKITVVVRVGKSDKSNDRVTLHIDVIDTGVGIEKVSLERIFRHFEQNSKSNNQKHGGTGLGLAISRKLAEKMNGTLSATSTLGKGSCFTLTLNGVQLIKQFKTANSEERTYEFDDSVILIVDDIESNRILLTKYLEKYPFELFIAENGLEAVELAKKTKPNLVLMDLRMPVLDGYEATKQIKKQQDTVVVALTASALEDEESLEKQKVFDDFLRKPILKSKLIATMAKFLSHQSQVNQQQHDNISWDLNVSDDSQLGRFVNSAFIEQICSAHQLGDVETIADLAEQLSQQSKSEQHDGFAQYAEELTFACESFDVERIDYLVELFSTEVAG